MSERYDALVVGGGHNGLAAAGYLALESPATMRAELNRLMREDGWHPAHSADPAARERVP